MAKEINLRTIFLATILTILTTSLAWADLTDGLVAHYKLDGDAIDSAGSNDGILVNGPTWTTGKIDGALEFDGVDDYILIPDDDSLTPSEAITIAFWFYTRDGQNSGIHKWASCPSEPSSPGNSRAYFLELQSDDNKIDFWVHSSVSVHDTISTNTEILPDRWYHVVATFDKGDVAMYIDGQLDNCDTMSVSSIMNDVQPLMIGAQWRYCDADHLVDKLNGKIDDVRIYNRALSAEEVEELYTAGAAKLESLELIGPDEVAENFHAQYKAIAHYDNNSTADVTSSADWSVEPNVLANITSGLLTTQMLDLPADITVTAQYNEGDVNTIAQKDVSILPICPQGSALKFDGVDDYVEIGDSENLRFNGTEPFSVSVWFKRLEYNGGNECIIAKGYNGDPENANYILGTWNNEIGWFWEHDTGSNVLLSSGVTPEIGRWYYIVGVWDGLKQTIYVDSVIRNSVVPAGMPESGNNRPIVIGRVTGGSSISTSYVNGLIDEVSIYNRALSAEEIQTLMHTRPDTDDPNLVGCWSFDEGVDQAAADSSIYHNDGTLGSTSEADSSDPNWVDSDAPVGICTLDGLVNRNINDILDRKLGILDELGLLLDKEDALLEFMDDAFHNGQLDHLNKGDVVTAKQKVLGAIQQEEQAETAVDNSIDKLDDALDVLGL